MNKKALSLAICMALALPTASNALSLGEIESKSSLNQPFQGRINLLSTSVAEAKNLRIRVAPPEIFNRVGIDRPAFLNSIRFRTTVQNGRPVILVSSNQPINEPFLNFLLEVSWPNGQLLKEYTVLLDPPVLMRPNTAIASNNAGVRAEPRAQGRITRPAAQPRPQQRQIQQPRRVVRAAAPARRAPARRAPVQRAPVRRVAAAPRVRNYTVRRGDTLTKIANKMGYRGIRREQMMVALFEKNRRAFSQNNMNNLKAGVSISRPSLQEARAVSAKTAKSQIIAQARKWKQKRAELLAKKRGTGKLASNQSNSAHMEVVGKSGSVNGKSGSGDGSVADLRQQLTMLTESLTTKQQENQELKSRVSELESLLRNKTRLINLKSEQLASIQARLGGEIEAGGEAGSVEPGGIDQGTIVEEAIDTQIGNEGSDIQQQVAGDLANENGEIIRTPENEAIVDSNTFESVVEEPQVPVEVKKPASAFKPEVAEDSFDIMGLLGSPTALGLGAGSLLAALGGLLYMRRRKSKGNEEVEDFSAFIDDGLNEQSDEAEIDPTINNTDMIDESEFVMHDQVEEKSEENDADASTGLDDDLEDIIQEADVYIVYGLHDQAESEIKRAIEKYPDSPALHSKLLENYKAAGDKEAFEDATKAFLDLEVGGKEQYWDEICEWGNKLIPDSKLYESSSLGNATVAATGAAMVAGTAVAEGNDELTDAIESVEDTSEDLVEDDLIDDLVDDKIDDDMMQFDLDDDLESFGLDDVTSDDTETEISEVAEVDEDLSEFDLDVGLDDDLETDSLDDLLDVTEVAEEDKADIKEVAGDDLDIANLSLDLDADDFDKIMPEDHAYKATDKADELEGEIVDLGLDQDQKEDDNLLADFEDNLSFMDLDDDSEGFEDTQVESKIDLAKAYIDMGDIDGARSTLEEVIEEGNEDQKRQAEELLQDHG